MKLKVFREYSKKKQVLFVGCLVVILFMAAIYIYRTYAIYQEREDFDVIKGNVPDQNYDVYFSYVLKSEDGSEELLSSIPQDKNYNVSIHCDKGANGFWNYELWGPQITNITQSRTKCRVQFEAPIRLLTDIIQNAPFVSSGDGLYEVEHTDAEISYTSDSSAINHLKQVEYRYAGKNPHNYVLFNDELWRIIGLVNTQEGQRVKIIRNESLGYYSTDSSISSINNDGGINEWSQTDIMKLLNPGYESESIGGSLYWNRLSGNCYINSSSVTKECNFRDIGLLPSAKGMIDLITWNLGTIIGDYTSLGTTLNLYSSERSGNIGKQCKESNTCNDTELRKISWRGYLGLVYPSDYGYATSGGDISNRSTCLNSALHSYPEDCYLNNWINSVEGIATITPRPISNDAYGFFRISYDGSQIGGTIASFPSSIVPTLYLKNSVKVVNGNGEKETPYELII